MDKINFRIHYSFDQNKTRFKTEVELPEEFLQNCSSEDLKEFCSYLSDKIKVYVNLEKKGLE